MNSEDGHFMVCVLNFESDRLPKQFKLAFNNCLDLKSSLILTIK